MIKKIEQICAGFLWKGNFQSAKGAKVSWCSICFPKAEGGLGLRDRSFLRKRLIQLLMKMKKQSGVGTNCVV